MGFHAAQALQGRFDAGPGEFVLGDQVAALLLEVEVLLLERTVLPVELRAQSDQLIDLFFEGLEGIVRHAGTTCAALKRAVNIGMGSLQVNAVATAL